MLHRINIIADYREKPSGIPDLLLNRFRSVERMMTASHEELLKIEGIGKNKAKQIIDFIKN